MAKLNKNLRELNVKLAFLIPNLGKSLYSFWSLNDTITKYFL